MSEMKEIPGLRGYYATAEGEIYSRRPINGKGAMSTTARRIKPLKCSNGRYLQFGADGKKYLIHAAVALAFIGDRPNGYEVSHKDGDGHNNAVSNLEYMTHKDNEAMKRRHGTAAVGERNGRAKLTAETASSIRRLVAEQGRGAAAKIARELGVSESAISLIRTGRRWATPSPC